MHIHLGRSEGHLQSIELSHVNHHKALPHINKLIQSSLKNYVHDIHKICVEHSFLNDEDYQALTSLFVQCDQLHDIHLHANHIDLEHLIDLFAVLSGKKLNSLCVTDNWMGEDCSDDLFAFLTRQHNLRSIDFSLNWLGDKGVISLLESLNTNLQQLQLSCNDFKLDGIAAICDFINQCKKLRQLDISYNRFDVRAAEKIAGFIKKNDSVVSLKINSNDIKDHGAMLIAEALKHNNKLESLDLSDNCISIDAARQLIVGGLENGAMKYLDLRHNELGQEKINNIKGWQGVMEVVV